MWIILHNYGWVNGMRDEARSTGGPDLPISDVQISDLDISLLALFAGWAAAEEVRERLADRGFAGIRFSDGVLFQHLVGADRTISELAVRMAVTQQAASKAVADLRRRGLVVLTVDPADARARRVALSDHGAAAVEAGRTVRAALVAEIAAACGDPDMAAAQRVLQMMIERRGGDLAIRSRRVLPPG